MESIGIIISIRPFNERDAVAHIFTRDYGVMAGMLRGAVCARRGRPMVGMVGTVSWNARLDSQLGVFHWEMRSNPAAAVMFSRDGVMIINSMFALINTLLPERAAYTTLYDETINAIAKITNAPATTVYLEWEISLLRELGYALELSHCSGCGRHDNLNFLSPRTGRAVCDECAAPYMNRVYKLPLNLAITARFLANAATAQGTEMPAARTMLKI
ncbi:MAG: DNA repair protein RecO [Alphaproteobacteria bacterium]|nr:DNA repair protein RecO [Alphaproteobacteria bacterium]